jgi:HNH endonuclease
MKTDHTLTADRLRELVRYEDGCLYWLPGSQGRTSGPLGSRAGHKHRLQVHVDGVARYVHRLIWLYHHGEWPAGQIDHINGDKHDNRIENLRVVSQSENSQNVSHRGVTFESRRSSANRPWRARIMLDGKSISLGYYATEADARAEYMRAKAVYHAAWATGVGAT